jgi:PilZ domain
MTPEMAFECVLVSQDSWVFSTMHRILKEFSITTSICLSTSKAAKLLEEGGADLVVLDWESESSSRLVDEIWRSTTSQKPTILAVAAESQALPKVHVVLRKPVTRESAAHAMRAAYSRMVQDFRKHVRYAVMTGVVATDDRNQSRVVTVTNIGDGGVGLSTKEQLSVGDNLSFMLCLPGIRTEISVQARVLWTRQYGAAGCEFVRIPRDDLQILTEWLRSRSRIKKPLIDVESAV